jgi:hypothetical protein
MSIYDGIGGIEEIVAAGLEVRSVQQALSGKGVFWCCRSRTSNKAAESGLGWPVRCVQ